MRFMRRVEETGRPISLPLKLLALSLSLIIRTARFIRDMRLRELRRRRCIKYMRVILVILMWHLSLKVFRLFEENTTSVEK